LYEYRIDLIGVIDEILLVAFGYCYHEAVDVAHLSAPVDKSVTTHEGISACEGVILVKVPAPVESCVLLGHRQREIECGTAIGPGFRPQPPAVRGHQCTADRKAHAQAAA